MRIPLFFAACLGVGTTVVAQQPIGASDEPTETIVAMEVLEEGRDTWRPVGSSGVTAAGCKVNLRATNNGNGRIVIVGGTSAVRTRAGWWKDLWHNSWFGRVSPGESFQTVVNLDLACSAGRRYRFTLEKFSANGLSVLGTYVAYYPSATAFTSEVDIKLGDLNRFFK